MKKNHRILWIDELRGIAAILVLIGHLVPNESKIKIIIYSIHIPIFFFISGYLYHNEINFKQYLKKLFKTILIPYFICNLISFHIYLFLNYITFDWKMFFQNIFYLTGNIYWNSSLWFLPVFFLSSICFFVKNKNNIRNQYFMLFVLLTHIILLKFKVILPFGIHIVPAGIFWMCIGNICANQEKWFDQIMVFNKKHTMLYSVILILCIFISIKIGRMNISINYYPNYLLNIFTSFLSVLSVIYFVKKLPYNKILDLYSKNSLWMFSTQRMLMTIYFYFVHNKYSLFKNYLFVIALFLIIYAVAFYMKDLERNYKVKK